jgi:hypothetical protein
MVGHEVEGGVKVLLVWIAIGVLFGLETGGGRLCVVVREGEVRTPTTTTHADALFGKENKQLRRSAETPAHMSRTLSALRLSCSRWWHTPRLMCIWARRAVRLARSSVLPWIAASRALTAAA